MAEPKKTYSKRRKKGFERTSGLVQARIRDVSESRGFSESRLLTHWAEVVGEQIAAMCEPVKVSYAKGGFGATLTLLTTGAFAPMLQAQLPQITERVNAVYGYKAISRITITQTAPIGFAEGRAKFLTKNEPKDEPVKPEILADAKHMSDGVEDTALKAALEKFATSFLTHQDKKDHNTQKATT